MSYLTAGPTVRAGVGSRLESVRSHRLHERAVLPFGASGLWALRTAGLSDWPSRRVTIDSLRREIPAKGVEDIVVDDKKLELGRVKGSNARNILEIEDIAEEDRIC